MTAHPLIAGLDYSTRALDLALVRGRELVDVQRHPLGVDLSAQLGVMVRIVQDLHARDVAAVVLEERWTRVEKGISSALKIRDVSTRFETLAVAAGLKVVWVPVNTWHAVVLGNGGLKSDAAKREALLYCERVYGRKLDSHNAADAVCIATWGASVLRLEMARATNGRATVGR